MEKNQNSFQGIQQGSHCATIKVILTQEPIGPPPAESVHYFWSGPRLTMNAGRKLKSHGLQRRPTLPPRSQTRPFLMLFIVERSHCTEIGSTPTREQSTGLHRRQMREMVPMQFWSGQTKWLGILSQESQGKGPDTKVLPTFPK